MNSARHAVGIAAERAQDFRDFEQRRRTDIRAMGEAEEHQERTPLEVLVGDGAAILIGQAERAADRGDLRHGRRRYPPAHDQHDRKAEHEPGEKGAGDQENAAAAGGHVGAFRSRALRSRRQDRPGSSRRIRPCRSAPTARRLPASNTPIAAATISSGREDVTAELVSDIDALRRQAERRPLAHHIGPIAAADNSARLRARRSVQPR